MNHRTEGVLVSLGGIDAAPPAMLNTYGRLLGKPREEGTSDKVYRDDLKYMLRQKYREDQAQNGVRIQPNHEEAQRDAWQHLVRTGTGHTLDLCGYALYRPRLEQETDDFYRRRLDKALKAADMKTVPVKVELSTGKPMPEGLASSLLDQLRARADQSIPFQVTLGDGAAEDLRKAPPSDNEWRAEGPELGPEGNDSDERWVSANEAGQLVAHDKAPSLVKHMTDDINVTRALSTKAAAVVARELNLMAAAYIAATVQIRLSEERVKAVQQRLTASGQREIDARASCRQAFDAAEDAVAARATTLDGLSYVFGVLDQHGVPDVLGQKSAGPEDREAFLLRCVHRAAALDALLLITGTRKATAGYGSQVVGAQPVPLGSTIRGDR